MNGSGDPRTYRHESRNFQVPLSPVRPDLKVKVFSGGSPTRLRGPSRHDNRPSATRTLEDFEFREAELLVDRVRDDLEWRKVGWRVWAMVEKHAKSSFSLLC